MAAVSKGVFVQGEGLQLTKLLDALQRLYAVRDAQTFPAVMMSVVQDLVPCVNSSFDSINLQTGAAHNLFAGLTSLSHEEFMVRWNALCHEHPGIKFLESGGKANVFTVTDFLSQREFRKTAIYHEVFRACGGGYQIGVILPVPRHVVGVAINRDQDFAPEERSLIELLHPHFVQAFQNTQLFASLQGKKDVDYRAWRNHGFTRRECEVLRWMIEGKRNKEIALILNVNLRTVDKHVENIFARLHVETRTAAASEANRLLQNEVILPFDRPSQTE